MAFDFPNSPSVGQAANGYVWDGEKWRASNSGPGPVLATKKNYIINGAMMVSQENGTTAGTTSGYYPVDGWFVTVGTGACSMQQVISRTPAGSPNRIRLTVTTADASVAATDIVWFQYGLEGLRVADLGFGTAAAKTITIQFGCKAPAGTYSIVIKNTSPNRSYAAEYVISAGEANTDVVKSVTIPGDTTGTWAIDNTVGIILRFALMAGTTYQVAPGAWAATDAVGSTNQFNFMGTNGNIFELFDVSLTEGTVAPPFMVPDYASELAACMRYWEKGQLGWDGYAQSAVYSSSTVFFKAVKRAAPTVITVNVSASSFPSTASSVDASTPGALLGFKAYRQANGTGGANFTDTYTANARL